MRFHVKLQKAEEGWDAPAWQETVFEEELVLLSEQLAVGAVTAKWKQKGFRV